MLEVLTQLKVLMEVKMEPMLVAVEVAQEEQV